jgi:hypothetical protein
MMNCASLWNPPKGLRRLLIVTCLAILPLSAVAQGQILIGAGSQIDTGSGQIELGCASLTVAGLATGRWSGIENVELDSSARLETSQLDFSGDWTSTSLQDISGQVNWQQQCNSLDGLMLGDNRFASLSITATTDVLRRLDANGEQTITESLRLLGGENPLQLRSTVSGQPARLTVPVSANWSIGRVDVADIDSSGGQGLAPGDPSNFQSVDSGGNRNWFLGAVAVPVPILGWPGLLLLMAVTLAVARRRLVMVSQTSKIV